MPMVLGQNQYGKAETRVVRVRRDTDRHEVKDLNVGVALSGDLSDTHFTGGNDKVLPTDTMKNTVFAFAREHGIDSAETYGICLARHFVESQPSITRARIRIEEYPWNRITSAPGRDRFVGADEIRHSFVRDGSETRTTEIVWEHGRVRVISGLKDLVVMNTTASEFRGYIKDRYTTLQEAYDRILATRVGARWRFSFDASAGASEPDWERSYAQVRRHLLEAFAETYSYSLQQSLYAMADRVLTHRHEVDEVRLSLPNKHHFLVDMERMGVENDREVYYAADRPYGLIEGTVHREGVTPLIPVD
ncbi:factor-independent urate hydroxylase [Embleya hyalina]|uniref:Uricase n=1 Tax=Embleya hyalina TaxID=516124 RepID=A0A401YFR8_9ACTN|nr:urate oxidase [Embleya hyalina]GCD93408.1 uricase [Embleya hyalina]